MSAEAGRESRARRALPWIVGVAVALIVAAVHAATHPGEVFTPLADETLLVPIALRTKDPELFGSDKWLAVCSEVFSVAYSHLLGTLLRWFDDPVVALRLLSIPFHAVLLAGTWRCGERFAGRHAAAAAVALTSVPPAVDVVFPPGEALPRDLVFALFPWFLLGLAATRTRRLAGAALFVALGAAANLHPLTALHVTGLLLLLGFALDPTPRALVDACLRLGGFAIGAAPYVAQYLGRPVVDGPVDESVYAWRLGNMAGETWGAWSLRMEPLLWLAAGAAILAVAARRAGSPLPRTLVVGTVATLALAAIGPVLGEHVRFFRAIQFERMGRFAMWFLAIDYAIGGVAVARVRGPVAVVGATAAFVVAAGVPWFGERGPLSTAIRAVERRAGIPFAPARPAELPSREGVDPMQHDYRDAFLAVGRFAREQTPPGTLFLVPPEQWGPFRGYARRGAAVTRKEGGAALSYLGARGMEWFGDYAEAVKVYASGTPAQWSGAAAKWGARYAVVDPGTAAPPWRVVLEAAPFRVLEAPPR